MNSHSNPLMQRDGLPKFDQIKAEDFIPAVKAVFTKTEKVLILLMILLIFKL